jgi:hypothetical protein
LNLQSAVLPGDNPVRRDADSHLTALKGWMRDNRRANSLEAVGGEQRTQALRSMVEPTTEALNAARDATEAWIEQSLKMQEDRHTVPVRPRREDAIEAFRAFRSGAETLTAIYLRQGDAASALAEIDRTAARKITPPSLYERLQRAAEGGDALAWRELLAWLWNPERKDSPGPPDNEADPELAVDPNVLKGALFGTAVEAYRLDPLLSDVNIALATLLVQLGLPEAAPLVLADAAVPHPEPAMLSGSLGLVLQAILREDEAEDTASARRIYAAAAPLLTLAARPEFKGRLEPGPGRLELAMGTIETRSGNLGAAKPLLERSTVSEPTVEALLTLAAIERQAGHADSAVALLSRALATPEAKQNPLSAGEAQLGIFEIEKDRGSVDKAKAALTYAQRSTRASAPATRSPKGTPSAFSPACSSALPTPPRPRARPSAPFWRRAKTSTSSPPPCSTRRNAHSCAKTSPPRGPRSTAGSPATCPTTTSSTPRSGSSSPSEKPRPAATVPPPAPSPAFATTVAGPVASPPGGSAV